MEGRIARTPALYSRQLSRLTGAEVWVKFENLQATGSFKERGAVNRLLQLTPEERERGVICASAGNHAQSLAHHAQQLGVPATIVMPSTTPLVKVEQTRRAGATIVLEGETFDDAVRHAQAVRAERNLVFVPAFDDPDIVIGQGTCALELLADAPGLDVILVPIGGGGLIAGMAVAAKHIKPSVRIFGVEAAMYPSFHARRAGAPNPSGGQTIAEGIAVKTVSDLTFAIAAPLIEDVLLVQEADIEHAVALYCSVEKTVAEGAGAATLAALLVNRERFKGLKCGLTLSGGNIDMRLLASVLNRALVREGRILHLRFVGDDRPGILANIARVIGDSGGNIMQVQHHRTTLDAPAKGVEFEIELEARDAAHAEQVLGALAAAGFAPRRV